MLAGFYFEDSVLDVLCRFKVLVLEDNIYFWMNEPWILENLNAFNRNLIEAAVNGKIDWLDSIASRFCKTHPENDSCSVSITATLGFIAWNEDCFLFLRNKTYIWRK